jgi:NodT family efflux transporter outer membrane factor (OMF) lipoprotein
VNTEFSKGRGNQDADEQTGEKRTADSHRLSLGVSWEIDIWGRLVDEYASSKHALTASKEDYLSARDALAARVIQTWIEQVANRHAVSIESERVSVLAHIEGVLIDRYKDGMGSLDEYSAAKSRTQIARADLSIQQTAWRESIRRLEVLLGRPPQGARLTGKHLPSVAPPPIHAPVSIMRHRPDIRAAVARVESARRLSRAADKAMLPGVTLTGELFRSATHLGNIGSSTTYWGILGSVFQPLFEGGRLRGQAQARQSEADAALLELYSIVLRALKEVEDSLDLDRELAIQSAALESAVRESEISSRYFAERYRQGLDSIQNLLIAKEQEMSVKIRLNQVAFQQLSNRIDLALALGAGVNDARSVPENTIENTTTP